MTQSKTESLIESIVNVLIGYSVAVASQLLVFPLFDIDVPLSDNFMIGAWFTVISLIRSYVIRRWFNRKKPERNVAADKLNLALNTIHNWLVCYPVCTAEDMAQSIPDMEYIASEALTEYKGE